MTIVNNLCEEKVKSDSFNSKPLEVKTYSLPINYLVPKNKSHTL